MAACPTVEVVGPAGLVVINVEDLKDWEARGYKIHVPTPPEEPKTSGGKKGSKE